MVGIIVGWKERKSKQHTKPEGVYYSTINETKLQQTSKNKPEATHSEVNDIQLSKENLKSADCTIADKVIMQDNPSYSIPVNMQDNPAYAGLSSTKQ